MFIVNPVELDECKYSEAVKIANSEVNGPVIQRKTSIHQITLFGKKLIGFDEVFYEENCIGWVFGTGVWSYRGFVGGKGLKLLFQDFINRGELSRTELRGQYAILYYTATSDSINLIMDSSGIQNLYISNTGVFSTSFLACLYSMEKPGTLNRLAAIENICTGHIISPDTLVNEIKRFHPNALADFNSVHFSIMVNNPTGEFGRLAYKSRKEAIDSQISIIDELFDIFRGLHGNGVDFGLTGGLDSRLLLAFALRNWDKERISVYSYCRSRHGSEMYLDEPIAIDVAKSIDKELKLVGIEHPYDMQADHLYDTIKSSFNFYDGHVRMHTQFFEAYNTSQYKLKVIGESLLNTSGIGGEQYRNMERYGFRTWNLRSFLKYKTIRFTSGEALKKDRLNDLLDFLVQKVKCRLKVGNTLNHIDVKRYYNEIINGDRLGARNNMENKLYWFISPFAESKVAEHAYNISNLFGMFNFTFQLEMLDRINSDLANVTTDYGFTPASGLSLRNKTIELIKTLTPWELFYYVKVRNIYKPNTYPLFHQLQKHPFIEECLHMLEDAIPELSFEHIYSRPDTMPLAVNLGFFIHSLTNKNKLVV